MKYIRTKDGRIIEGYRAVIKELLKDKINFVQAEVICGETIKEADNLEELFDEQIIEYVDKGGKVIKREFVNHIYEGEIPEGEPEYYGAIRTEKGLRYVAKEIEGEWRLI